MVSGFERDVTKLLSLLCLFIDVDLEKFFLSFLKIEVKSELWFVYGWNDNSPALFSTSSCSGSLSDLFLAISLLDAIALWYICTPLSMVILSLGAWFATSRGENVHMACSSLFESSLAYLWSSLVTFPYSTIDENDQLPFLVLVSV